MHIRAFGQHFRDISNVIMVGVLLWIGILLLHPALAFAAKVNIAPTTITLTEGQSQTITITLDEPIIGPGPDPAYVLLPVTSSDVSRLTADPASINYTAADWFQAKTFTITAVNDALDNGDVTVTLSSLADSDSEYYNNFLASRLVNIIDNDDAPIVVSATDQTSPPAAETLADTGTNVFPYQVTAIATLLLSMAAVFIVQLKKSSTPE